MKPFSAPNRLLAELDPETAGRVIASAADVALVLDDAGAIRDLAFGGEDATLAAEHDRWLGRPWAETVTVESRAKIDALLADAAKGLGGRPRQVNHPSPAGADVPVLYTAVAIAPPGRVIAVGRNLRTLAQLQQRLVDAQQAIDRDYWRLRQAESRYRMLFQASAEALLIVEGGGGFKVLEANPAALAIRCEPPAAGLGVGRAFPDAFDPAGATAVRDLLARVLASGWPGDARARAADGRRTWIVTASLFRQEASALLLLRLDDAERAQSPLAAERRSALAALDAAPDGFVLVDRAGTIVLANRAFLALAQLMSAEQTRGVSIERWLGRPGVDLSVLMANLVRERVVRLFATTVRGEQGEEVEVEISAAAIDAEAPALYALQIRPIGARIAAGARPAAPVPRTVEQLTELVGRVPLRELVREATEMIERMSIEAALELTQDNRASAAELLGLSRQGLYDKLRRYGLRDSANAGAEPPAGNA